MQQKAVDDRRSGYRSDIAADGLPVDANHPF
jgi:hypothetical protein